MSWLRLDDGYDTHPKMLELTEVERWRWTRLLLYCARHRTEGRVRRSVLSDVNLTRSLQKLVRLHLLAPDEDEGVYVVTSWEEFNPRDPTAAERMRRHRRNGTVTEGVTEGVTDRNADRNEGVTEPVTVTDADRNSRVAARARPVPSPTQESKPRAVTSLETPTGEQDEQPLDDSFQRLLEQAMVKEI